MAGKTVGIVGAGVSGLLACKYTLQRGFRPLVFEAELGIGGVWLRTFRTTRLQTPRHFYQFIDFPWSEEVKEQRPDAKKVMAYLESYMRHFDLLRHIRFGSRVVAVEYVGVSEEEMESWELWAGTGEAFGADGGKGRWQLTVEHSGGGVEVYEVDFLILCLGKFSGLPNMPSFPPGRGPEVFHGKVLHSMDYSDMDHSSAAELLKGKRTVVVGYSKSAVDIAAECSDANGCILLYRNIHTTFIIYLFALILRFNLAIQSNLFLGANNPCTLICRQTRWLISDTYAWGVSLAFLFNTRLAELLAHKPGEGPLLSILATLLSPLRWLVSKFVESYIKWKTPITKFGLSPNHSFREGLTSSSLAFMPESFYERMEEGSIIPKKSKSLCFYENGVITDDGVLVPASVVIFATGFKGEEKIRGIFTSPTLRKIIMESTSIHLYRDCIHPRIPQLAIIGCCESLVPFKTSEMMSIWATHFLNGKFRLPPIKSMEEVVSQWQEFMKQYSWRGASLATLHNWYNDQLCKDIGFDPRRKMGLLGWITPFHAEDYKELLQ